MNILYLHQYFVTPQMPGGTRSYELARRLVAAGHRVVMIASDQQGSGGDDGQGWRKTVEAGIEVCWIPVRYDNRMSFAARMRAFLTFAWRAARASTQFKPDVVFATSTPLTIALPAVYAARRHRIPMVFEVRDLWPAVPIAMGVLRNPLARAAALWLERFAYRNSHHVVALAPGMKEHVVSTGYSSERVTVIPNGADIAAFAVHRDAGQALRASHSWLGDRPLILYAGAIGRVNGVNWLASMAEALLKRDAQVRIVILGSGSEEAAVRKLATELGVLGNNLFMLGTVPKQDVPLWLDAADAAVALIDGPEILWKHATQNKFFDALAAGTPIWSNFRGWQSEIAEEAGAGGVLDSDATRAADQLLTALHDRAGNARAGRAALALATQRFGRDQHGAMLERVLADAVSQFRSNARR